MTVADLGIAVHSESAKVAATDLNALTAASDKAEAASARLDRATSKTNADMAKIAASVEKANAMLAKLVSVGEQTNAALSKLTTASTTAAVAVERLDRATGTAARSVGIIAPAVQKNVKALNDNAAAEKLTSNQWLNLSRQGNDVITMFALGAAPMQIFASQAGQIYDALEQGPGGLRGSLRAIGESLLSLVTRAPLATAAIAATGIAVAAYKISGAGQIKSLDEILAEHEAIIKKLGTAYDEVRKHAKEYAEDPSVVNLQLKSNAEDKARAIAKTLADARTEIEEEAFARGPNNTQVLQKQYEPFFAAIKAFLDGGTLDEFRKKIAAIAEAQPDLSPTAQGLAALTDGFAAIIGPLSAVSDNLSAADAAFSQFKNAIQNVDPDPLKKALQEIYDKAADGQHSIEEVHDELAKLERANPSFSGILAGFKSIIDAAFDATVQMKTLLDLPGFTQGGSGSPNGRQKLPVGILPDSAPTPTARPNYEDYLASVDKANAKLARAANPYRDLLKSADDRIAQMRTELDLLGKVGVAADTTRHFQELLSRATDRGRKIGEDQRKELHDRAEAMAKLEDATKRAKLQQDLLFDRDQMFRSPIDQTIAETLHSAGLKVDFGSYEAGMIRFNEQLKQAKDYADDFASTFVDGIMNGENALDALGDAASSVLSNIAKQLIQMAMDQMINSLLQGLSGAFGGGFGSGFTANTSLTSYLTGDSWSGLRLAGGGSGPGSATSDNILARLSPGEFVVNAASAQKYLPLLETINKAPAFASGGRVSEGIAPLRSALMFGGEAAIPRADHNGKINIAVYNNGQPVDATAKQSTDGNGGRMVEIFLEKKIEDQVTRPSASTNRSLRQSFGLSQQVVRR